MRLKKDYNLHYPLLKATLGVIIPNVSTTIEICNQEKPPGDHHSGKNTSRIYYWERNDLIPTIEMEP